jgi:hypothetical protein
MLLPPPPNPPPPPPPLPDEAVLLLLRPEAVAVPRGPGPAGPVLAAPAALEPPLDAVVDAWLCDPFAIAACSLSLQYVPVPLSLPQSLTIRTPANKLLPLLCRFLQLYNSIKIKQVRPSLSMFPFPMIFTLLVLICFENCSRPSSKLLTFTVKTLSGKTTR